jgi:hypothetical protein
MMKNKMILSMALLMGAVTFTACSDSNNDNGGGGSDEFNIVITTPQVDNDTYAENTTPANYNDKRFGNDAIDGCENLVDELTKANSIIASSKLTEMQEEYLYQVLRNLVDNVIVPTYTKLADDVEDLEKTLKGLTVSTITQAQINKACEDFKDARLNWERSEAFLMGAASDFDIDPTIDSWPLNRSLLLSYFNNGMSEEMLDDATILGFHAMEFILFRDGQPRKVAEFQGTDTYKGFEKITGEQELAYAQTICTLLKQRCFQLQVAWEGEKNASRVAVVKAAGLPYTTEAGLSYGENLTGAGINSKSTFKSLKSAIAQVLSDDEGSCVGIANEVGTAKIANPFSSGDVSYVESPYSYNSIADFRDNIRSIRNIWLGSTDKTANRYSFHTFFASVNQNKVNESLEGAFVNTIAAISNMPSPFVKYCCAIWNIAFEDDEDW